MNSRLEMMDYDTEEKTKESEAKIRKDLKKKKDLLDLKKKIKRQRMTYQ